MGSQLSSSSVHCSPAQRTKHSRSSPSPRMSRIFSTSQYSPSMWPSRPPHASMYRCW